MLRVTPDAPALRQAARRSSNGRADGRRPERHEPRRARTRFAARPPERIARNRDLCCRSQSTYRRHSSRRQRGRAPLCQTRSRRRRTPRGGRRSTWRRRIPRGEMHSRPSGGDTKLYTGARCLARVPESAQSKVQLVETRDVRFRETAEGRQRSSTSRSQKQASFRGFNMLLGWDCGAENPAARLQLLAGRSMPCTTVLPNVVTTVSHTAHPTSCRRRQPPGPLPK